MTRVISILVRLSTMNIKCSNDWGQLKEIIVGTAKGYRIPELNRSFKSCQFPEYDEKDIQVGPYPDWVVEEAEEDLDLLDTAKRETHEEIGISNDFISFWGHLDPVYTLGTGWKIFPFIGVVKSDIETIKNEEEVQDQSKATKPVRS